MSGRVAAPLRRTFPKAALRRRTHWAPTLAVIGHRGAHPAACGSTAEQLLTTSHAAFVTCQRCKSILEAAAS